MGKNKMIKFLDLLNEDSTSNDADNFVAFLKSKLDLDNLKEEYKSKVGDLVRSEEDYAIDYYNVIDDLANEDIE